MPPLARDPIVTRLAEIASIAARGWLESLPAKATTVIDLHTLRQQRLLIHELEKEIDLLVTQFYPPTAYGDE